MIDESDRQWAREGLATPQLTDPAGSEASAIEEASFNSELLKIVGEFRLSVRTASCLKNDNVIYIGDPM
jgi:DNA-directed RNA polymerase alpha subunit